MQVVNVRDEQPQGTAPQDPRLFFGIYSVLPRKWRDKAREKQHAHEWMIVDMSDGTFRRGTDVSKAATSFGIGTDGTVVHVTFRRLYGLVDGGSEA